MKTFAENGLCRSIFSLVTFIGVNVVSVGSVSPAIIYSGPQNLSVQGVLNATQILSIDLAGDIGSSDNLQLSITSVSLGSVGANDVVPGAEVALLSAPSDFPLVERLDFGDPFPSSFIVGSGSKILWQSSPPGGLDIGEFKDVTGYAAMVFGTFGGGPQYSGWIHLSVEGYSLLMDPLAKLTVIDWAYSDVVGERISMGQIIELPVPVPSTFSLYVSGFVALLIYSVGTPGAIRDAWTRCRVLASL